ncbi:MAG: hypothetical protein ACOC55_00920 [Candidatus Natronoplasma sp.]
MNNMLRDNFAIFFVILLGLVFFAVAVAVSVLFDYPNVVPVGIGIVGIFLIILPFTYQKGQQG